MLSTIPKARILSKYSLNSAQSSTKGMCPASGKAFTAVSREDWKEVSSPG